VGALQAEARKATKASTSVNATASGNANRRAPVARRLEESGSSCSGYVIDHVKRLECGGADDPSNMQWQTVAEGKAKDRTERNSR
jgi:hypothetical protein